MMKSSDTAIKKYNESTFLYAKVFISEQNVIFPNM